MNNFTGFPRQKLSFKRKNRVWRTKCVDWADNFTFGFDSFIRKSFHNKLINYNLINGRLTMSDVEYILNPNQLDAGFIPDRIQHYPIINSKLNVIRGEESNRRTTFRGIVTNPDAVSEIENEKKGLLLQELEQWATKDSQSEEEAQRDLEKIQNYYKYEWQDIREIRVNYLLKHYIKELPFSLKFNEGIMDAMIVGEEIYQCDIMGGEPTIDRINPLKIQVMRSGYSNRIEDSDMIILWDFWSPGRIIDSYYDVLSAKDMDYINEITFNSNTDDMDNIDETKRFTFVDPSDSVYGEGALIEGFLHSNATPYDSNYMDNNGNLRVIRLYWKSQRRIKKITSYNMETGEEEFHFYPETYVVNEHLGEEEEIFWINEAWEGTKIGKDIYVNMRPRVVQYNRLSNPSRCHFGIVGSIYNLNDNKPFSVVDMAKPYNYLYDVIHDRLNKNLASNWGKILKMDLAMVPKGWEVEKWMYYAKVNHIAVTDSFKEGNKGAATGKLAGMLNNQSSGYIDADQGDIIQNDIGLLEFIKNEMSEVIGITRQREGQISNRETVGGVERSVLQSSHITEWLFTVHDDTKRRVMECFIETAKAALKGKSKKFQHIESDGTSRLIDIDGDEFAECDYGIVMDNSDESQAIVDRITELAQALVQNQAISTSTLIKVWRNNLSTSEITRTIEADEQAIQERQAQQQEQQMQMQQAEIDARQAAEQAKMELEYAKIEMDQYKVDQDNSTKIAIEEIKMFNVNSASEMQNSIEKEKLDMSKELQGMKDDAALEREKLKAKTAIQTKRQQTKSN